MALFQPYEQPKLGEYIYGAWIHKLYLHDEESIAQKYTYSQFLLSKGFYIQTETNISGYDDFYNEQQEKGLKTLKPNDYGYRHELEDKYGKDINKSLSVIEHARYINVLVLSLAVVFGYLAARLLTNNNVSFVFLILYSSNYLLIKNGLMAHTDGFLILFMNMSVYFMLKYLIIGKMMPYGILCGLVIGLSFSTKLNGVLSIFILLIIMVYKNMLNKSLYIKAVSHYLTIFAVMFSIFILLNPYTWDDPIKKTINMFIYRNEIVNEQINTYNIAHLPYIKDRAYAIIDSLYFLYSPFGPTSIINYLFVALSSIGMLSVIRSFTKLKLESIYLLTSSTVFLVFILTTVKIYQERYFLPLIFYSLLFTAIGVLRTGVFVRKTLKTYLFNISKTNH